MTNLIAKIKSVVSATALLATTIVMGGLGFAFVGMLALFALITLGVALIAAPFVALRPVAGQDTETQSNNSAEVTA